MTVPETLAARLSTNTALVSLLTGGIWTRPIVWGVYDAAGHPDPPGSTPEAFGPKGQPRPACSIADADESADPLGPDASFQGFPQLWFYAPATQSGKEAIGTAWELAFGSLHRWRFPTVNGTAVEARVAGRLRTMDDPDMDGRVLGTMRLQLVGLWRNTD